MERALSHQPTPKNPASVNQYAGHIVSANETIETTSNFDHFYEKYVNSRKPVKITGRANLPVDIDDFKLAKIVETLDYHELLQVERKHGFGFGLGTVRELKSLQQIVNLLEQGNDLYYLTTQYEEHETEQDGQIGDHNGDLSEEELENGEELGENTGIPDLDDYSDSDDEPEQTTTGKSAQTFHIALPQPTDTADSDSEWSVALMRDDYQDSDNDQQSDPETDLDLDDITYRVKTLLQPPLLTLVHNPQFPISPEPFANLVTQQINLWMGTSGQKSKKPDLTHHTTAGLGKYVPLGNSSGLHHDHADNLYVLAEGRKRFTLYSPADACKLSTIGNIRKVYGNGLIDYVRDDNAPYWQPMRDDGAILADHARWKTGSGNNDEKESQPQPEKETQDHQKLDPPSFSKIPPVLAHLDELTDEKEIAALEKFAHENFPGFLELNKIEVWLDQGDMLYVPCGWFHEVTSFADGDNGAHVALNWWFVPPVTHDRENPYSDEYWPEDFAITLRAIKHAKNN